MKKKGKSAAKKKLPKPRKTNFVAVSKAPRDTEPTKIVKPARKQGGPGRPFRPKPLADTLSGNKPAKKYTTEELQKVIERAAKTANSRLAALEKQGLTKYAYKRVEAMTGKPNKPRFSRAIKSMTRAQLESELSSLRDFLSMKSSTVSGYKATVAAKYTRLLEAGFKGTEDELAFLFEKYTASEIEKIFGSDIIYQAIKTRDKEAFETFDAILEGRNKDIYVNGDKAQGRLLQKMMQKGL
jgi:hypothetical protein|nr:MAG TPA: hypothetical protein [Caudoviricetes sp.]